MTPSPHDGPLGIHTPPLHTNHPSHAHDVQFVDPSHASHGSTIPSPQNQAAQVSQV